MRGRGTPSPSSSSGTRAPAGEPCLCSPGPSSGGTPWDCPGGQLAATITSAYLIRSLQTVRSEDVPQASLAQGAVGAQGRAVWPRGLWERRGEPPGLEAERSSPTGFQPWLLEET